MDWRLLLPLLSVPRCCQDAADRVYRLDLGVFGDVGVGVQRESGAVMAHHSGDCFHVSPVLPGNTPLDTERFSLEIGIRIK